MQDTPRIEILRQRLFISHDHKKQRNITSEYTIKSNHDGLTNIMILSDKFMPNLMVHDEDGSILSVMTTNNLKKLIKIHIEKKPIKKLERIYSQIISEKIHLIWLKIPKKKAMNKGDVRTISFNYSPRHEEQSKSVLKILIKKQPHPLYYTLFTPNEFDFKQTKFGLFQDDDKMKHGHQKPESVQRFKTYNSNLFKIRSYNKNSFEIRYSFKPTSVSSGPTKIGLFTLIALSSMMTVFKYAVLLEIIPNAGLLSRHAEIGLFVIGGSLLLPQLTNNESIRARYTKWYLIPIILGFLILISEIPIMPTS